jgi:hypothetical protein
MYKPTPLWLKGIKTYTWYGLFLLSLLVILGRDVHWIHIFLWVVLSAYMTIRDRPVTKPVRYDSRKAFAGKLQLLMPDRYEVAEHSASQLVFQPESGFWRFFIDPVIVNMESDGAELTGSANQIDRLRRKLANEGVIKVRTREEMRAAKEKARD